MDWHTRYTQQARWTEPLRSYLFQKTGISAASRLLEVGCGTGAILQTLVPQTNAAQHGLDANLTAITQAASNAPGAHLLCAAGERLPYPPATFDITYCHFLLLWVKDPLPLLREMKRVTRPGGYLLALAEPDYGGRIDHPPALSRLGQLQTLALQQQGADPYIGRKLAALLRQAGIQQVQSGILGAEWVNTPNPAEANLEWQTLQQDLQNQLSAQEQQRLQEIDARARENGERTLFIPTFFAWGRV
jgi:ubiquinone/menaquinone biosynthesis C-methylase UbiE